jgi:hypothetical protein
MFDQKKPPGGGRRPGITHSRHDQKMVGGRGPKTSPRSRWAAKVAPMRLQRTAIAITLTAIAYAIAHIASTIGADRISP